MEASGMSDDIREVMRSMPFSPLKRVDRSGRHKDNAQQHEGGWTEEEAGEDDGRRREALEALTREVDEANERLKRAGKAVRLRLAAAAGETAIEVILPGDQGQEVVTRRIPPGEMAAWVIRLETAEGIVIDEKF